MKLLTIGVAISIIARAVVGLSIALCQCLNGGRGSPKGNWPHKLISIKRIVRKLANGTFHHKKKENAIP